jgi:hypothetical protein
VQDEELTITMSKQSASTRAYTAAGGEQARAPPEPSMSHVFGHAQTMCSESRHLRCG